MKLSIVIPCYNERATVRALVEAVRAVPVPEKEIIIVDDCSTDGTREVLEGEIAPLVDKIIYHEKNKGKGSALQTGFAAATGGAVVVQDADLEYDPHELPRLLKHIEEGAEAVYGSRFAGGCPQQGSLWWRTHYFGNRLLTLASNIFTGYRLTDMETCYKMIRADVLKKITLEEPRFGFEPEVTAKLSRLKVKIVELPISYRGRLHEHGKKIGWKDGFRALWAIVKHSFWRPGR